MEFKTPEVGSLLAPFSSRTKSFVLRQANLADSPSLQVYGYRTRHPKGLFEDVQFLLKMTHLKGAGRRNLPDNVPEGSRLVTFLEFDRNGQVMPENAYPFGQENNYYLSPEDQVIPIISPFKPSPGHYDYV